MRENLPLMPGLTQLVLKLETLGWKVAIASGGFTFFAEYLRDKLRLTAVVANELEIMDVIYRQCDRRHRRRAVQSENSDSPRAGV